MFSSVFSLAQLDALAMGKPVGVDKMIRGHASEGLRQSAALAASALGESSVLTPGQISMTLRQPYGVTAGIVRFLPPRSLSSPFSY